MPLFRKKDPGGATYDILPLGNTFEEMAGCRYAMAIMEHGSSSGVPQAMSNDFRDLILAADVLRKLGTEADKIVSGVSVMVEGDAADQYDVFMKLAREILHADRKNEIKQIVPGWVTSIHVG